MLLRHAAAQRLRHHPQAAVVGHVELLFQLFVRKALQRVVHQAVGVLFQAADGLHQGGLEGRGDAHHLAGRLHLGAEHAPRVDELVERPARYLDHAVIERRLEAGVGFFGDGVGDFVQRIAQRDFGGDLRDGVPRRLGGQRGGAAHARVDLNHVVLEAVGVQGELHVAAALDLQLPDDGERRAAQHLQLPVRKGLARRDDDGVAGVDADGVDVLHIADGDAVAVAVPHHFVLDFLPAGDAALNQDLVHAAAVQPDRRDAPQSLLVGRDAAAAAAERVGRAHHHRVADGFGGLDALVQAFGDDALRHRLPDARHRLFKQLPVLGHPDGFGLGADHLHVMLFEEAGFLQLDGEVQGVLAAERRQDAVGFLLEDDLPHRIGRKRLDIDPVGNLPVGHNRRRVGVDEDRLDALLAQRAAGLRPGIVELRGLPDDNRAGADYHDFFDIFSSAHSRSPPISERKRSNRKPVSCGPGEASGWNCTEKILPFL